MCVVGLIPYGDRIRSIREKHDFGGETVQGHRERRSGLRRGKDRAVDEEAMGGVRRPGRARAAPHTTGIKRHVGRGMIMLY